MSTPLISHPFRLAPNGAVFCREQSDDEYVAERIVILCTTIPGERPLVPGFGIADPVFAGFDPNILRTQLQIYGPQVDLNAVNVKSETENAQEVQITFSSLTETENEVTS